ncbi:MAG: metalloregulator ArsR/SmtB family transcription factor [Parvularculales bacterium]
MDVIEQAKIERAAVIAQALSHEARLRICAMLLNGEASVTSLCERLGSPQHRVSQHLAILRRADIVTTRRQSRQIFYSLTDGLVAALVKTLLNRPNSERHSLKGLHFEAGRFAEAGRS